MMDSAKDFFMEAAWRDFINFAWGSKEPNFREAFEKATGKEPLRLAPISPLERMIDEATGFKGDTADAYVEDFVRWLTDTQWGYDDAPAAYRVKYPRPIDTPTEGE